LAVERDNGPPADRCSKRTREALGVLGQHRLMAAALAAEAPVDGQPLAPLRPGKIVAIGLNYFLVTAVGALLLVPMPLVHEAVRRPVAAAQYVALIWLVASLAMVGGALGAGLEADSTVREAAYGYLPDIEPPAQPQTRARGGSQAALSHAGTQALATTSRTSAP
jgi:hypothetical protein